jgi:hypothetical protein
LGTGAGIFGAASATASGAGPRDIFATDFNSDGKMDIVINAAGDGTACVHMGNGNGTFGVSIPFTIGSAPNAITSADFNGDNKPDIASANQASANASVLINKAPTVSASTNTLLLCTGSSATLSANGAVTYSWSTGGSGSSISVSPVVTTNYMVVGSDATGCENGTVVTQNVSTCASIQQTANENSGVSVYPNPFREQTTMQLQITSGSSVQVNLFNAVGQKINSIENRHLEAGTYNYNLNVPVKGMYFLMVTVNGITRTHKIVNAE